MARRTGGVTAFMATLLKLILFIDAQNVYHRARETFALGTDSHIDGQIDPWAVAELIAARGGPRQEPVEVMGVRIYTGYHTPERDSRAYASYRKQRASWEQSGCHVVARAVRYSGPDDRHGREKGIDVALAVDYVRLAIQHEFEIGVIFRWIQTWPQLWSLSKASMIQVSCLQLQLGTAKERLRRSTHQECGVIVSARPITSPFMIQPITLLSNQ